jgi:DNA-binding NarL/FixJ family response regulator
VGDVTAPEGILIIDDHKVLSYALAQALRLDGFDPVDVVDNLDQRSVMAQATSMRPAIALLDLHLTDDSLGTPLIAPLRSVGAQVVVLTASGERLLLGEALEAGAEAVLDKALSFNELADALRTVLAGRSAMSLTDRQTMMEEYRRAAASGDPFIALTRLSKREAQVLAGLVDGLAPKDIARALGVAVPTIRTQIRTLFGKLDVNSQRAAVALALNSGWDPTVHRDW